MATIEKEPLTEEIIAIEWDMFDKVNNVGGRASCQDNYPTFYVMRAAQFNAWSKELRESYLDDLHAAQDANRNLLTEKYAYMDGHEYMGEECVLGHKQALCAEIGQCMADETETLHARWPHLAKRSRPLARKDENGLASVDRYLEGELMTYSVRTLQLLLSYIDELHADGQSLSELILSNTLRMAGFQDLADAEAKLG